MQKQTFSLINQDSTNINNPHAPKLYINSDENADSPFDSILEYLAVSSNNRIFEDRDEIFPQKIEKEIQEENNKVLSVKKVRIVEKEAKDFLVDLYDRVEKKSPKSPEKFYDSISDSQNDANLVKNYIESLTQNVVINSPEKNMNLIENKPIIIKQNLEFSENIEISIPVKNIKNTNGNYLLVAPFLQSISKDLNSVKERLDQMQTGNQMEAVISQFKQNYVFFIQ